MRQLLPDLVLFPLSSGPPAPILKALNALSSSLRQSPNAMAMPPSAPLSAPFTPTSTALPSVVVICGNCGYTEFYNVHTLGIADVLGIYSKVVPHGR